MSVMLVFCVHLVIYPQQPQQQLELPETHKMSSLFARAGGTVRHYRRCGPPIRVQIVTSPPLSSSWAGQETVLGRFSTAFGLCGNHLVETENALQPEPIFINVYGAQESIQGINSASLCSLAGRYDNPISTRCLALIDCLKIPAQSPYF
jgi:hypothetical protein